jgi:GH25 family lysozyme M1 (1,4-beta-N-acetylmuramidase)
LFKNDLGEIPLQVDYEWTYHNYRKANPRPEDLYGFMETWKRLTGQECIIYTSQGFWNEFGSKSNYYAGKELWVANYKVDKPNIPSPFTKWLFWQFTENGNGELYGVNKYEERAVDLNYFNGTQAEFDKRFGLVKSPVEPSQKIGALLTEDANRLKDTSLSIHVNQLKDEKPELF